MMTTGVTSKTSKGKRPAKALEGARWDILAWVFLAGFLVFFLAADQLHRSVCWFLLVPDELIGQWAGGDWARVSVLDRVPLLLLSAAILLGAAAWGRLILRPCRLTGDLSGAEIGLFSLAIGLSCLSLVTLLLGCSGLLQNRNLFLGLLILPVLVEMVFLKSGFRKLAGEPVGIAADVDARLNRLSMRWLWLLVPPALIVVLGGMLPPQDFDVREYHLQVPREWYEAGRVEFLPHNVYGNMPLGAEILSIPAMAIWPGENDGWWGAMVGKTILALFGLLTAWGIYLFGRRWFSASAGLAGAVMFLATPWVIHVGVNGLVELAVGFYGLMAVYAAYLARQQPGRLAWSGLAGFFAGSAVACKYPALLMVVLPVLIYLLIQAGRAAPRVGLVFVVATVVGCGPWFAKNAVMAENPTYPLLSNWFGGKTRTPDRIEQWQRAHQVPVDATGQRYSIAGFGNSLVRFAGGDRWQSPLLVPLALLSLAWGWRRSEVWWLAALVAYTFLAWWLLTHRIERFWVPMLPLVALLSGLGSVQLCRAAPAPSLPCLLVLATLFGTLAGSSSLLGDNRFLVRLGPLRDGPAVVGEFEDSSHAHLHRYLNRHVPPSAGKVLLVGDAEPFDLRVPVLYNTCFDECIFERLMRGRDARQRLSALREQGITHVFVYWSLIDRYRKPGNYGFTDYVVRDLVRRELVGQGILHPLPIDMSAEEGELFEVGHRVVEISGEPESGQETP
ncbi:MAG: glycosyltransferase family 39 protein [Pirellulaceae bacterium]